MGSSAAEPLNPPGGPASEGAASGTPRRTPSGDAILVPGDESERGMRVSASGPSRVAAKAGASSFKRMSACSSPSVSQPLASVSSPLSNSSPLESSLSLSSSSWLTTHANLGWQFETEPSPQATRMKPPEAPITSPTHVKDAASGGTRGFSRTDRDVRSSPGCSGVPSTRAARAARAASMATETGVLAEASASSASSYSDEASLSSSSPSFSVLRSSSLSRSSRSFSACASMQANGSPFSFRRASSASNRDGATTISPSRNPYSSSSRISYTETRSRSSSRSTAALDPKSTHRSSAATHRMVFAHGSGNAASGGSHRTVATRSSWSTVSTTPKGESVATSDEESPAPPGAPAGATPVCPCRGTAAASAPAPSAAAMSATPAAPAAAVPPSARGGFRSSARRVTNCPGQKSCSPRCSCGTKSRAAIRRVVLPSCHSTSTYVRVPTTVAAGRSAGIAAFSETRLSLNRRASARFISSAAPTDSHTDAATPAPALAAWCARAMPKPSTPPPSYRSFETFETSGKSLSYPSEGIRFSASPASPDARVAFVHVWDFGGGVSGTTVLSPSWKQVCAKCVSGLSADAGICVGGAGAPPSACVPGVRGARGNAPFAE